MPLPDSETSVGHSFGLEVDGVPIEGLRDVTGLKMEQDAIEVRENGPGGDTAVRTLPGRWKSPEVTLVRGLTSDGSLDAWVKESQAGEPGGARRDGVISVFDHEGAVVKKYVFRKAWPKSLEVGVLDVGGVRTLSERLVLVCDHLAAE